MVNFADMFLLFLRLKAHIFIYILSDFIVNTTGHFAGDGPFLFLHFVAFTSDALCYNDSVTYFNIIHTTYLIAINQGFI